MLPASSLSAELQHNTQLRCQRLDSGWLFRRFEAGTTEVAVELPHTPFVADLDGNNLWFGVCAYRRRLKLPPRTRGERVVLYVGAAMQTTRVLVDGVEAGAHTGGYLPFEIDLDGFIAGQNEVDLTIELDNRHCETVPPGKTIDELDFCWYGGLYREVELRVYPPVHLTDSVYPETGGGGLFVRTESIEARGATLAVSAGIANSSTETATVELHWVLTDAEGQEVVRQRGSTTTLEAGVSRVLASELKVRDAELWSPASPHLYQLTAILVQAGSGNILDRREVDCGIRRITFSRSGGFTINGRRRRLRGVNRHQDFPHVGYAAPRAAQYRDAQRIKEAGFDYVRLSHYPQSPHFLDACDQLGLVVANCLPGWQFYGGELFQQRCVENARRLIRRDRNHPCVVLWELSLNETKMPVGFMRRLHDIGHEEYPGDQMFTCGWMDEFDVFLHSRQHGAIHSWRNDDKALVVAEYGDWEYFAANEGFDQKLGTGLLDPKGNSRKRRGDGEAGLLQQARNHVEALNDTLASPAVLDGLWSVNDYPRGHDLVRATCGIMDSFRVPKFSYHFFRSQRDPKETGADWRGGAVVFAATRWQASLPDDRLWVFSNCETVELWVNGKLLKPARGPDSERWPALPHPPFEFDDVRYLPGEVEAVGRIGGRVAARHRVRTPGKPVRLVVWSDQANVRPRAGETDLLMVHAELQDKAGTVCSDASASVEFESSASAEIVGPREWVTEAGMASTVVRIPSDTGAFQIWAKSSTVPNLLAGKLEGLGSRKDTR